MDSLPRIVFPPELPVSQRRDDIARAIAENQVVIVAGATGSGKTTQLPKICLELGREAIGHTQPRRLAARTIAERIAEELGQEVGGLVGYQVRFTDKASKDTRIKLMTDGILLNEMHHDRMLSKYDTIIIDEAHERSLNIDFLLGYLKQLLPKRPDLKLIITSATIDPQSFSKHFDDAPIVEVSGRTFPVEIRYRPLVADAPPEGDDDDPSTGSGNTTPDRDVFEAIGDAVDELGREGDGDILVFLSGENEIRDAEESLKGKFANRSSAGGVTEILPLYGRLSSADQHRVFQRSSTPGVRRRIVLATNVAETSLTVPGIKYVIDAGTARISRYSVRSKVQRLPIEAISQASANQRSGRSGRTSDGIAIRLYSQQDFEKRPEFTEPEILRTNLAAVILQMISLGLGDIASFPFLQPPESRGIKDGLDLLGELGALRTASSSSASSSDANTRSKTPDAQPRLTRIGRDLARLPIEPRFARMVIESKETGTSREVMLIVAGLTIQDPRERPLERRQRADELHGRFTDPTSDFLTLLNLWNYLEEKQSELSSSAFRRLCKNEFLNYLRIREWQDVYRQLRQLSRPLGLTIGEPAVNPDGIHRSILSGLLSHIGLKDAVKKDYVGARQSRFSIFPGSVLNKKQPAAVMSAELVETSRLFARMNAAIDPAWAEKLAGDLVKRSYSEPRWEKKQGSVVAYERVTLFGVPIVEKRRIQFSRVDPSYARELFIRHALVEGDWESQQAFDRANRAFRKELEQIEERSRRRDLLTDDEAVFDFYNERIPRDVFSQRTFEGWWKTAKHDTPDLLTMTIDALVPEGAPEIDENEYPTTWQQEDQRLGLSYRFEPGTEDDGVTATVPLALLPRLKPESFEYQVPGLRVELVTALIKSLPKNIRRNFVPSTDWAVRLVAETPEGGGDEGYLAALASTMSRLAHVSVSASDFDRERLPSHLRMSFRVVDERGKTLSVGKDLPALQQKHRGAARESVAKATTRISSDLERSGLTTWSIGELPRLVDTKQHGGVIRAYPALVDDGSSVSLRLMTSPDEQALQTPDGIVRLLLLAVPSPLSYVREHLTQNEKLMLATSPYQNVQALFDDCLRAVAQRVLFEVAPDGMLWNEAGFQTARDRLSATVMDELYATVGVVTTVLSAARDAEKALKGVTSMALLAALGDAREQLKGLIYPGFVSATGTTQLRQLPRYLKALTQRLDKLAENAARDRAWMTEVQAATSRYTDAGGRIPLAPHSPPNIVRARWLLEEFRVSLFAQSLGTAEPVSMQRIQKALVPAGR
ncbi:ATP-dependent RNA helicase HrpA [Agreia sp. Leaf244]|uniref:ATP-dependent RNA helicase HrpA n=1 Tax=Agreia sp. Leaf244 TaxID=1736305 RepID=UPI0006F4FD82|nr:ATP-dependent RNA helicase HrpA [Agreia sp. Leaf244]KQO05010.1 ATP-dependent RNA helicase HrpA [Agreia sp. Leaf244]